MKPRTNSQRAGVSVFKRLSALRRKRCPSTSIVAMHVNRSSKNGKNPSKSATQTVPSAGVMRNASCPTPPSCSRAAAGTFPNTGATAPRPRPQAMRVPPHRATPAASLRRARQPLPVQPRPQRRAVPLPDNARRPTAAFFSPGSAAVRCAARNRNTFESLPT